MKITAIIQARMGSTRLPGKVLMNLGGETVLGRVVRRLRRATLIDEIAVATTNCAADDAVVRESDRLGVPYFRGSENDVLDRYYRAAKKFASEAVVRITADCPVIDPHVVDETIRVFRDQCADYTSNGLLPIYPRGLDTEVFTYEALERAWREGREPHQREHVTPYFYEHPELFSLASVRNDADRSQYRWTLDTVEDLELLRAIYTRFDNNDDFGWEEIIQVMEREPQLAQLNSHVVQKALHASR